VPSADGSLLYVFDAAGRHLRTEDSITREALLEFRYADYPIPGESETTQKLLTEIEDDFGNVTTIERDEDGVALAVVAPFGQRTELTMNPTTGYLQAVERDLDVGVERVELVTHPNGLLQSLQDPKNHLYNYSWDGEGRLDRVDDPENGWITLDLQELPNGHRVTQTTKGGRASSVEVTFLPTDEIRQILTLPTGLEIEALRKKDGSIEWTYPDDTEVTAEVEPEPRLGAGAKHVRSSRTVTPEDDLEYLVERQRSVAPGSGPLSLTQQTDSTTINGRTAISQYVSQTRTLTSTSPEGRASSVVFDTFGRVSEVREPGVETLYLSYDEHGRLAEGRQGPTPLLRKTTYGYDSEGFLETATDSLGKVTRFERDRVGRVTKTVLPDLREIQFEYDLNGNLIRVTPPSRPDHVFDHNAVDQVIEYAPPDLDPGTPGVPATTYGYDDDHKLTTITRPDGQVVTVVYEPSGRLDALVAPHGTVDYTYDPTSGKLDSISAPGGATVSYDYDGPWLREIAVGGPFAATIQLEADRPTPGQPATNFWLGKLRIDDDPATEIELEYDDDGLPTQVGDLDLYWETQATRAIGTQLFATGERVTRNSFGEVQTFKAGYCESACGGSPPVVGTALLDVTYQRDRYGRIEKKTEKTRADVASPQVTRVYDYHYDPDNGRLEQVDLDATPVETYAYDDNGNRTSWSTTFGSGTATYDDQDRLLIYGPLAFTYTDNGELLTRTNGAATTTYGYDVFGNLRTVDLPDGISIEYLIDGRNRRIGKKIEGVLVQRFLYLGGLSPLAELDAAGNVTTQYVYARGRNVPDYFVRGGVTYRIFTDHLGSVRYVLDAETGAIAQRMDYDAFGRVTLDTNPGFQPFAFAGGLYDPQTGLVRFGARDYDPEIGRWTAKDPIGFAGGSAGLYEYVSNEPVNRIDPSGLQERYSGMMREYVENPTLAFANTVGAGIATGVTALVAAPEIAMGCAARPGVCQSLAADLLNPNPGDLIPPVAPRAAPALQGLVDAVDLPGYSSFRAAKANLGSAGPGRVFDHVVEQSQIGRSGLAPELIHHPFNLNPVGAEINQLKANYYSSIRPYTGGRTVRDWLTGQSFEDQYEFGMEIVNRLQNGLSLP